MACHNRECPDGGCHQGGQHHRIGGQHHQIMHYKACKVQVLKIQPEYINQDAHLPDPQ